jgi:hypothetical protein
MIRWFSSELLYYCWCQMGLHNFHSQIIIWFLSAHARYSSSNINRISHLIIIVMLGLNTICQISKFSSPSLIHSIFRIFHFQIFILSWRSFSFYFGLFFLFYVYKMYWIGDVWEKRRERLSEIKYPLCSK